MAHNVVFVQSVALHSFEMEENKRTTRFKWPSNLIMYVQYEDGNSRSNGYGNWFIRRAHFMAPLGKRGYSGMLGVLVASFS